MTAEEEEVMRRAQAVVAAALEQPLRSKPMKVECIEMRCHPDDFEKIREAFDCPIVLDATVKPGSVHVVPYGYAEWIDVEIGFAK